MKFNGLKLFWIKIPEYLILAETPTLLEIICKQVRSISKGLLELLSDHASVAGISRLQSEFVVREKSEFRIV